MIQRLTFIYAVFLFFDDVNSVTKQASKARRVRAIKFSIKIFQRPEMSWERRNKKHSAISFSQNVPGAFKRKLITRRIALSTWPLPVGKPCSLNCA